MFKYSKYMPLCQVFGDRPSFRYNTLEYRLMYSRLRIAVAELSHFNEKQPESWRLRFPRACCVEEILLVLVWCRFRRKANAVKLPAEAH